MEAVRASIKVYQEMERIDCVKPSKVSVGELMFGDGKNSLPNLQIFIDIGELMLNKKQKTVKTLF